tara:strand:+ start:11525 stop:11752 length:228 start_codon:yes stop_codon:yes gene_type:complete
MNESIKIDGREDIIRDVNSKAIIKTSLQEKEVWLRKKERDNKILSNENEINKVKEELFEVKTILNEIKDFLRKSN